MRLSDLSQHQRVSELLQQLGEGRIDLEQFWNYMRQYGLADEEIDAFLSGRNVE